ncbi:MAG: hypothetical protein CL624_13070 [Arcobacter sp.]|nr:hypothetical protein [Arcobacter sp.]|tara:strand:- start:12567 stop:15917 length:3351 start_codon:yes stop_codon:yes gene_type:complete
MKSMIKKLFVGFAISALTFNIANADVSVIVGDGTNASTGDGGLAVDAQIGALRGMAFDSAGNLYFGDAGNNPTGDRIRKIDATTGIISTVAGDNSSSFSSTGTAIPDGSDPLSIGSQLWYPAIVGIIGDDLYFKTNKMLYKLQSSDNKIYQVAGLFTTNAQSCDNTTDGDSAIGSPLGDINYGIEEYDGKLLVATLCGVRTIDKTTGVIGTLPNTDNLDNDDSTSEYVAQLKMHNSKLYFTYGVMNGIGSVYEYDLVNQTATDYIANASIPGANNYSKYFAFDDNDNLYVESAQKMYYIEEGASSFTIPLGLTNSWSNRTIVQTLDEKVYAVGYSNLLFKDNKLYVPAEETRVIYAYTPNQAPTATDVNFTGTLEVGQELTGAYTYSDANSHTESGTTFKWYVSDDTNGTNKTAINGATSSTYTLTSSEVGKYISFEVTPNDGTDAGTTVESSINTTAVSEAADPISLPKGYFGQYYYYDFNVDSFGTLGEYRTVDISSKYNADVIWNYSDSADLDADLDGQGDAFFTDSFGTDYLISEGVTFGDDSTLYSEGEKNALPDNGVFVATTFHKEIKLAYSNSDNGFNGVAINETNYESLNGALIFDVKEHTYDNVYVYATTGSASTAGEKLKIKFHYSDGTTGESSEFIVPDWYSEITESEDVFYVVNGLDRYSHTASANNLDNDNDPAIFGFKIPVSDTTKTVEQIEIIPLSAYSGNTQTVIFGINIQDDELKGNVGTYITNISSDKPSWLNINGSTLSGIPTSDTTLSFAFMLTDGNSDINYRASLTIEAAMSSKEAVMNQEYTYTPTTTLTNPVWSIVSIPSWLTLLDTSTGQVSGTPTESGIFPVKLSVTDGTTTDYESFYVVVKSDTSNDASFNTTPATADSKDTYTHSFTVDGESKTTTIIAPTDATITSTADYVITKKDGISIAQGSVDMEVINFSDGTLEANQITTKNTTTKTAKIKILSPAGTVEFTDAQVSGQNETNIMSAVSKVDGTMTHTVSIPGETPSEVISSFEGATTTISDTEIKTEVEAKDLSATEGANWIMKAIAVTDSNGKTHTRFIMENTVTGEQKALDQTLTDSTPYETGATVEIKELSDGKQYFVTSAPVSDDLIVE